MGMDNVIPTSADASFYSKDLGNYYDRKYYKNEIIIDRVEQGTLCQSWVMQDRAVQVWVLSSVGYDMVWLDQGDLAVE